MKLRADLFFACSVPALRDTWGRCEWDLEGLWGCQVPVQPPGEPLMGAPGAPVCPPGKPVLSQAVCGLHRSCPAAAAGRSRVHGAPSPDPPPRLPARCPVQRTRSGPSGISPPPPRPRECIGTPTCPVPPGHGQVASPALGVPPAAGRGLHAGAARSSLRVGPWREGSPAGAVQGAGAWPPPRDARLVVPWGSVAPRPAAAHQPVPHPLPGVPGTLQPRPAPRRFPSSAVKQPGLGRPLPPQLAPRPRGSVAPQDPERPGGARGLLGALSFSLPPRPAPRSPLSRADLRQLPNTDPGPSRLEALVAAPALRPRKPLLAARGPPAGPCLRPAATTRPVPVLSRLFSGASPSPRPPLHPGPLGALVDPRSTHKSSAHVLLPRGSPLPGICGLLGSPACSHTQQLAGSLTRVN